MKSCSLFVHVRSLLLVTALLWSAGSASWGQGTCACDGFVASLGGFPNNPNVVDLVVVNECVAGDCSNCTLASCDINCDGIVDNTDSAIEVCMVVNGDVSGVSCCDQPMGSCTGHNTTVVPGLCFNGPQVTCEHPTVGGTYGGDGTVCTGQQLGIPATSEWGLATFAILLLTAGSVLVRRRALVA